MSLAQQNIGGLGRTLRRIGREANRAVDRVGHDISSAAEHIGDQVARDAEHLEEEAKRTRSHIENVIHEAGEEIQQFVDQTNANGLGAHIVADFRRNPENWAAVGGIMAMLPPPWNLIGLAIVAAASVRIQRNARKAAEAAADVATSDQPLDSGLKPGLAAQLLDLFRRHPIAALAALYVLYLLLRKRKA